MVDNFHAKPLLPKFEEHKSDTDSGRSSIHCEKELYGKCDDATVPVKTVSNHQLRVTRCTDDKLKAINHPKVSPTNVIGYENEPRCRGESGHRMLPTEPPTAAANGKCLQVKSRKNAILKRRNLYRRNTIDVSQFKEMESNRPLNEAHPNMSKSTNCLTRREPYAGDGFLEQIDRMTFMGSSMPGA